MVLHFDTYFNPEFSLGHRLLCTSMHRSMVAFFRQLPRDYAIFTTCYRINLRIYAASSGSSH